MTDSKEISFDAIIYAASLLRKKPNKWPKDSN